MSEVTLADDVLLSQGEEYYDETGSLSGWESDPHFLVAAISGDHRVLLPAVWAAGRRFFLTDENGNELAQWENDGSTYTPNFIFDPVVLPGGIAVLADTKGCLTEAMGAAMVRVLTEELDKLRLDAHISALDGGFDLEAGESAPFPADTKPPIGGEEQPAEQVEKYWYVARAVWLETTRGRRYQDVEYRRNDGTWVRNRTAAQGWAQSDRADMIVLVRELRTQADKEQRAIYGEVTGLLLPPDPDVDPWPMPPRELRAPDPGPSA
jgi:hypothetical protein